MKKGWTLAIVIAILFLLVGASVANAKINGTSEHLSIGTGALTKSDCPSHAVSLDGQTCYHGSCRLDWAGAHYKGCWYEKKDPKPCPDAVCTAEGWKQPK